jgi:hypothetical protein
MRGASNKKEVKFRQRSARLVREINLSPAKLAEPTKGELQRMLHQAVLNTQPKGGKK